MRSNLSHPVPHSSSSGNLNHLYGQDNGIGASNGSSNGGDDPLSSAFSHLGMSSDTAGAPMRSATAPLLPRSHASAFSNGGGIGGGSHRNPNVSVPDRSNSGTPNMVQMQQMQQQQMGPGVPSGAGVGYEQGGYGQQTQASFAQQQQQMAQMVQMAQMAQTQRQMGNGGMGGVGGGLGMGMGADQMAALGNFAGQPGMASVMAAMQAASSNVHGGGMQAMMQAGLAAGAANAQQGMGMMNGGPAGRGGQQGMAEVYQAAYAAAFYAQQQQLQQLLRLQAQAGANGGGLNQAALAAAAAGLLGQPPLNPAALQQLGIDVGGAGGMDGYGVGVGFGGAGNRGAANGMGGGRDGRKGPRGGKGNGRGSTNDTSAASLLLGGSLNRSASSGAMSGVGGQDSAQDIADMDARFGSVEECVGQVGVLARDQHGCRFLQRKFDDEGATAVDLCFDEIIAEVVELMMDPFGNYLVQKLLECCSDEQRMGVLRAVAKVPGEEEPEEPEEKKDTSDGKKEEDAAEKPADPKPKIPVRVPSYKGGGSDGEGVPELVSVALNTHGTRAVQKLVETLRTPEQIALATEALKPGVVTLIKDLNGNHVIQRCLQRLGADDNQFVYDAARVHSVEIATHRHGCCVLQRCIDHAAESQRRALVQEIASQALVLSQDPFGNYVVQYILDLGLPWCNAEVMMRLAGNYAELSMQKFSSNVVEKCLKLADASLEEHRNVVVREIMTSPLLDRLLMDPYGNYVVQSTLSVTKGTLHSELVERIRPHLPLIKNSPFGKRILRLLLENKK